MTDSPYSTELASVILHASAGAALLIGGALALGLLGRIGLRAVMGPGPRGPRRPSPEQMRRAAGASDYAPAPILGRAERRLFAQVEAIVRRDLPGHRVMGRLCLSEAVRTPVGTRHGVEATLGRSLGIAVIDRTGRVTSALDWDGAGPADPVRDTVLRRAGIDHLRVPTRWDPRWLRDRLVAGA